MRCNAGTYTVSEDTTSASACISCKSGTYSVSVDTTCCNTRMPNVSGKLACWQQEQSQRGRKIVKRGSNTKNVSEMTKNDSSGSNSVNDTHITNLQRRTSMRNSTPTLSVVRKWKKILRRTNISLNLHHEFYRLQHVFNVSNHLPNQSQKTVLGKRTIWIPILILTKISASLVVTRQNRVNPLKKRCEDLKLLRCLIRPTLGTRSTDPFFLAD